MKISLLFALLAVIALAACGAPTAQSAAERLAGTWTSDLATYTFDMDAT